MFCWSFIGWMVAWLGLWEKEGQIIKTYVRKMWWIFDNVMYILFVDRTWKKCVWKKSEIFISLMKKKNKRRRSTYEYSLAYSCKFSILYGYILKNEMTMHRIVAQSLLCHFLFSVGSSLSFILYVGIECGQIHQAPEKCESTCRPAMPR